MGNREWETGIGNRESGLDIRHCLWFRALPSGRGYLYSSRRQCGTFRRAENSERNRRQSEGPVGSGATSHLEGVDGGQAGEARLRTGSGRKPFDFAAERVTSLEGLENGRVHLLPKSIREGSTVRLLQSGPEENRVLVQGCIGIDFLNRRHPRRRSLQLARPPSQVAPTTPPDTSQAAWA
jgi:hypothetical protein